ncbi:MAG TPA: hypothetical protein VLI46_05705 [Ramlibacter sp.]|nr:hypothetical protein [Ramlibacter sp.]
MLQSQKLAIAAHLHVLLRRKTGRVTDTEWMAANLEYALEIVRFTRAKALEDGHPDLNEWADKLERAALEPSSPQKPLAQNALQLLKEHAPVVTLAPKASAPAPVPAPPAAPRQAQASGFGPSVFGDFLDTGAEPVRPRPPTGPRYVGGIR